MAFHGHHVEGHAVQVERVAHVVGHPLVNQPADRVIDIYGWKDLTTSKVGTPSGGAHLTVFWEGGLFQNEDLTIIIIVRKKSVRVWRVQLLLKLIQFFTVKKFEHWNLKLT
jgi:hypothetical protein